MTAILYLLYAMRTHLAIAIVLALAAGVVLAQEARISVDVSLVTLGVEVVDSNDRPVTTLKGDDFEIYEDGVRQQVRSFDSIETPYNILLLFDCSSSTEHDWPFLVEAMHRFTRTLRPQDRIEVAQFGSGFKVMQRWFARTNDSVDIVLQTRDSVCSGTDFYGAIKKGIDELQSVKGRRGIIVLSDGGHQQIPYRNVRGDSPFAARYVDAADDSDFQKVLKIASNSAAMLYFVAVDTDLNPDPEVGTSGRPGIFNPEDIYQKQQLRSRIEQLASVSGGRVVFPEDPEDVVMLYERMAQELGASYSLGYALPEGSKRDGTHHKIEVRVRDRSLRLRQSRDEYIR